MNIQRPQRGFALTEVLLAGVLATSIAVGLAMLFAQDRQDQVYKETASWMSAYTNAVAAFMAQRGTEDPVGVVLPPDVDVRGTPFAREQVGTDWLKSVDCGGSRPADAALLSCSVPNDFLGRFELPAPRVRFYWASDPGDPVTPAGTIESAAATPQTPQAIIDFGITRDAGGNVDATIASSLSAEINRRVYADVDGATGNNYAAAFHIHPDVDPVAQPAVFTAEVQSGNLRGFVDAAIQSTVFVRLDGQTVIRGTLVSENDNWTMITRDETGAENIEPTTPRASINTNDIFVRSAGLNGEWASETHELAEEAYRVAIRAPNFISNIRSGDTVTRPTCPAPLTSQINAVPAGFIGGSSLADTRLIAGVRTVIVTAATQWTVTMEVLYEGSTGFEPIPVDEMGLINVTVKCG